MIFDTHTHLNDDVFIGHEAEEIQKAHQMGVDQMAVVGYDGKGNERSLVLSQQFDEVYSIIGYHPTSISEYTKEAEERLEAQLTMPKVVALGEIGLDFYWMSDPVEDQVRGLKRQMDIARNLHLPISIHTRSQSIEGTEAYEMMYNILKENPMPGIIHSFNGNSEWMKKFVDLGMMISFSGVVTFKNAKATQEAAKEVPMESMLLETDAPYLAPVPKRGKQNVPAYTRYTAEFLADLKEISLDVLAKQTTENAHRLFRLGEFDGKN